MLNWVREEFKKNKEETNADSVALHITRAEKSYKELSAALRLSK